MAEELGVVIAAAGAGRRMNSNINKQYMLLRSRPVLAYSLDVFEKLKFVNSIVVVAHPNDIEYCKNHVLRSGGYKKVKAVIPGGQERQDSVWEGLKYIAGNSDFVAVHDGARPLLSRALVSDLFEQVKEWGAAIPGLPAHETLKKIKNDLFVEATLDRSQIMAVQTPQLFRYDKIIKAYEKALAEGVKGTDDASLYEKYAGQVKIVPGPRYNIKITTPEDIIVAEALLDYVQ